ncbi:MAG TPA: hypothetical protein VGB87_03570 [Vicinamibacteria bacterium]
MAKLVSRVMRRAFLAVLLPGLLLVLASAIARAAAAPDRLSTEMDRWAAFLRTNESTDDTWKQLKAGAEPLMAQAQAALASGRRLLALQRFLAARAQLSAAAYAQAPPARAAKDAGGFEAEWTRMGGALGDRLARPSPGALDGVRPAVLRALGEVALPQSRVFYDASLEYGRATMPEYGLHYLGQARSAGETVDLCRALAEPGGERPPGVRSVGSEIEALEEEMLAAYRPPLSVDRHAEFIAASAQLKEARELDGLGLGHGALLRYLQAAQRFWPLREARGSGAAAGRDAEPLGGRIRAFEKRFATSGADHSLGRLFLERAQEAVAASPPETEIAQAIVSDVLPRYLHALEPARPRPPGRDPAFTVTLVRWPYT